MASGGRKPTDKRGATDQRGTNVTPLAKRGTNVAPLAKRTFHSQAQGLQPLGFV